MQFDKCKLSIKATNAAGNDNDNDKIDESKNQINENEKKYINDEEKLSNENEHNDLNELKETNDKSNDTRRESVVITPDIVRGVENYTEDDIATHRAKLEELQLRQKLMEEQNKKRKEMLAKALADR